MKMIKINGVDRLFIKSEEAVAAGISKGTQDSATARDKRKKTDFPLFINDPEDLRRSLIDYEKMNKDWQFKIQSKYGDVYNHLAKEPIRKMVQWDDKAEEFYLSYRYGNDKTLPIETVKKYTSAVSFLNMLKKVSDDKKTIKKTLNLTIEQFYNHAINIIKNDNIDLPSSYRRLLATCKEYNERGYASMIDWRFGNTIAAKIKDELSEAALIKMISHGNQYDDVFVAQQYNRWAKENDYKEIHHSTVGVWRLKKELDIAMPREGNAKLKDKFLRQAKGFRATFPGCMWESDDNHLDLLFIDIDDTTPGKFSHRYKAIVVVDSFNDYVVGYAYGENLSFEMVYAAYLSAMYYVRSITGAWYLPHETKTDRWGLKSLQPYYEKIGKYFPTPVGSKNRGYIENFFGSPHFKRCLKIGANNYTGNNMTAKHRGVNDEMVALNKKNRPLIGQESIAQVENFFHRLRHLPQTSGKSKHAEWLEAWNTLAIEKKRSITDEQFLLKFGIVHNPDRPIRITNRGVEPQIGGKRYSYDLVTPSLSQYVGKAVSVIYDPYDMSRVLITDNESVRLMGVDARLNSRALEDSNVDSRTYLNAILKEKKDDVVKIAERNDRRSLVMQSAGLDAESLLHAGVMIKELKQDAEQKVLVQKIDGSTYEDDYLDQM